MDIEMKLSQLKKTGPHCTLRSCDKYKQYLKSQLSVLASQQDDVYGALLDDIAEEAVKHNCSGCEMNNA